MGMEIKRGIAVSGGIAIGTALVLDSEGFRIPHRYIDPARRDDEIARLRAALATAAAEARAGHQSLSARFGVQIGAILAAHTMLLEDPGWADRVSAEVRAHGYSAEYAVSRVMRDFVKALEELPPESHHFAARAADFYDVEKRLLAHLLGQQREQTWNLREPVIVLAHDLTPSETAAFDPRQVIAFATEAGGRTSHTAIMAGALEIPAVVGLSRFLADVSGGDLVIVDGTDGLLIIDPDDETLARYQRHRSELADLADSLGELRELPAETRCGCRISLMGNIEFPQEAAHCVARGADGVGLYRTEFLYLGRQSDPTEEEHFEAYRSVIAALPGQPVIVRTLDLGADKFSPASWSAPVERNPFLGVRSVRLCLRNLTLFKVQLRAILRASALGDLRILFPMVSTLLELRQCKMILAEVKEDLEEEGIAFNRNLPVGTMIEVPSAALISDQLAREVDFFSIGTNDLVQYTLAADRTNEHVAQLYNPADPAVLRLIRMVLGAAAKQGIEANLCGEMSGEPIYTLLLLGLGLRHFSVSPHNLPEVKKLIRLVTVAEAERVAAEVETMETARDVTNYLREQTRRILPEAVP